MKMNLTGAIEILKLHKHTTDKFKHSIGDKYVSDAIDTVVTELEKPLPTDEKTVCPECLKKCTNEELRMFGGLCEECSTDFN
jgi:hypothetical protein